MRDADWRTLTAALFTRARRDDAGAARLVAAAPGAARPGAARVAQRSAASSPQRGVERAPHEGPRDYAARAARAPARRAARILRIGALYIGLRYGAHASANGVARLRRMVRGAAPRMKRLVALRCPRCCWRCRAGRAAPRPRYAERPEVQAFIREMVKRHGFVERELALPVLAREARRAGARMRSAAPAERALLGGVPRHASSPSGASPRASSSGTQHRARAGARASASTACRRSTSSRSSASRPSTAATRAAGAWWMRSPRSPSTIRRAPSFFRSELEQYLLLARDAGVDVFSVRGSYAGAIGIPQFMPSSTRALRGGLRRQRRASTCSRNAADAIGSVANFLKEHGWQAGGDGAVRARASSGDGWRAPCRRRHRAEAPHRRAARAPASQFAAAAELDSALGALVELRRRSAPSEYRVGLQNFYVLTRYNRSAFYASAVARPGARR